MECPSKSLFLIIPRASNTQSSQDVLEFHHSISILIEGPENEACERPWVAIRASIVGRRLGRIEKRTVETLKVVDVQLAARAVLLRKYEGVRVFLNNAPC